MLDALRSKPRVWPLFARMQPEFSRHIKNIPFILMKLYSRKVGMWTNDWSYLIQAICSNFFKKEKTPRRSQACVESISEILQVIGEVFSRARGTLERRLCSQVSRRDNFTILIIPNKLSELGQMRVCCRKPNSVILICGSPGLKMLWLVRIQVNNLTYFFSFLSMIFSSESHTHTYTHI